MSEITGENPPITIEDLNVPPEPDTQNELEVEWVQQVVKVPGGMTTQKEVTLEAGTVLCVLFGRVPDHPEYRGRWYATLAKEVTLEMRKALPVMTGGYSDAYSCTFAEIGVLYVRVGLTD